MRTKCPGFLLLLFLLMLYTDSEAQTTCTTRGQNPASAFPVCGSSTFTQNNVPSCGGRRIPHPSCTAALQDVNPFWYKFTCFVTGTLGFTIVPLSASDDYDWQIFDVTNRNVNDVYTNASLVVASNWSGEVGVTGASAAGRRVLECANRGIPLFSAMPTLIQGHDYLMLVSNFSPSQRGYALSFSGGTAVITDPIPPSLNALYALCRNTTVSIKINKKIKCSSIAADGSDFSISPANANIIAATGVGCSTGFDTDSIVLTLSQPLTPATYTIGVKNGSDGNTLLDYCDASLPFSNSTINIAQVPVVSTASSNGPVCQGQTLLLSTPDLTDATYNWTGPNNYKSTQQNPVISNAQPNQSGTYKVAAVGLGGCVSANVDVLVTVNPTLVPKIDIVASKTTGCEGETISFTANTSNGGSNPSYQWKVNGNDVGSNSSSFSAGNLLQGDIVSCVLSSNALCASSSTAVSNAIAISIIPYGTPQVSISASSTSFCAGTNTSFTAIAGQVGASPVYQWNVNNVKVGSNSASFSSNSLANGDVVSCTVTSSAPCNTSPTASSNVITVTVVSNVTPTISISSSNTISCDGDAVTFSAAITNGGSQPMYQWKLNGQNVGSNSSSFVSTTLVNGDMVSCVLTSNASCATTATATSNNITVTISPYLNPGISIVGNASTICAGTNVVFTATPANGGNNPAFQWQLNGSNVGSSSNSYSNTSLANGDIISCTLTSNYACLLSPGASSNNLQITVEAYSTAAVSIIASNTSICAGNPVVFNATAVNTGNTSYQWKLNGNNVGTNSSSYSASNFNDNDVISCEVSSSLLCNTAPTASSNLIPLTVRPWQTPAISIVANDSSICVGTAVAFTASIANAGSSPIIQWQLNGNNVGSNSTSYSNNNLANNDRVTCMVTSSYVCPQPATVTAAPVLMDVSLPVVPAISISTAAGKICEGVTAVFTATATNGGSQPSYQWLLNGNSVGSNQASFGSSSLQQGDIVSCVLTSSAGCTPGGNTASSNKISVVIIPIENITLTIAASQTVICRGEDVSFTVAATANAGTNPRYQWRINGNSVGNGSTVFSSNSLQSSDVITCVVTPSAEVPCPASPTTGSNNISITVNPIPIVNAGPDAIILEGDGIQLNGQATATTILSYTWTPIQYLSNPAIANPYSKPAQTITYTLQATGTGNCKATDDITIKVLPKIEVPNAFSPNGDGINDQWMIKGLQAYSNASIEVFDRFGQLVFKSKGYNQPWNGSRNNKPLPVGVYYYIITPNVLVKPFSGSVTLLR